MNLRCAKRRIAHNRVDVEIVGLTQSQHEIKTDPVYFDRCCWSIHGFSINVFFFFFYMLCLFHQLKGRSPPTTFHDSLEACFLHRKNIYKSKKFLQLWACNYIATLWNINSQFWVRISKYKPFYILSRGRKDAFPLNFLFREVNWVMNAISYWLYKNTGPRFIFENRVLSVC